MFHLQDFANQDAKITPSPVLQYVLDMEQPYDTVLSCSDGKLGCHRIVLASASPFIADAFGPDHVSLIYSAKLA